MCRIPNLTDDLDKITFTFLDVETTGLNPHYGDRICEIALQQIRAGGEINEFQTLINPNRPISPGSSAINNITDEMVANAPSFCKIAKDFLELLDEAVLVCHNARFDLSFIGKHLRCLRLPLFENPVVDTLILARRHYDFRSNALGNVARCLGLPIKGEHRALSDVEITNRIFQQFLNDFRKKYSIETLGDLLDLQGGSVPFPQEEDIILPPILEEAFQKNKKIKIDYLSACGEVTTRVVEPLEINAYQDYVYLVAFCYLRQEERTFRLDRIANVRIV